MTLRVTATIEQVECIEQNEGALISQLDPTSEPYLWAAAFVIDGSQVLIRRSTRLHPPPALAATDQP